MNQVRLIKCSVPFCWTKAERSAFCAFPSNNSKKEQWQKILHVTKVTPYHTFVCKAHFKPEDFGPKKLKQNVSPTQRLPVGLSFLSTNLNGFLTTSFDEKNS